VRRVGSQASRSVFYEFKYHVPSDRQIRRLLVSGLVADIHQRSRGTSGMLRIRAALIREQDMVVNKKLILSIMRELDASQSQERPCSYGVPRGRPVSRRQVNHDSF
jgi:HTH-like domain